MHSVLAFLLVDAQQCSLHRGLLLQSDHHSSLVPEDLTAEKWVTCDDDVATSGMATDEEIIRTFLKKDNVLSESDDCEDDTEDETPHPVTVTEVREALGLLHRYALFATNENIGLQATKLTSLVESSITDSLVQKRLLTIFCRILLCKLACMHMYDA